MARQITVTFANIGQKTDIPDTVQIDGNVSYAEGYGIDYSREISDPQAKNFPRLKFNALMNDVTGVLQQFQQQGAPEWYVDTPYAQFARVKHDGNYYVALVDATEQEPGTGGDWAVDNVAAQARQNNLTATTDPTVNDDETEGYEPLSQWINTSSGEIFVLITASAGAANWQPGTLSIDELGNVALLNANTIGQNLIQSANPSAIRFLRANADNSVSWLTAADYRTALSLTNTDGMPEGSTNQYFTQVRVRSSPLTGFAAGVGFTAVIATDTILQAFNKLQGWLNGLGTASQANLVNSATDTTAGSVMTVGWMNLGTTSIGSAGDWSTAPTQFLASQVNGPVTTNYIRGIHVLLGGNGFNIGGREGRAWMQTLGYAGGQGDWKELWTTGNTSAAVQVLLSAANKAAMSTAVLTAYSETINTTAPNGTKPVSVWSAVNAGANADVAVVPKGNGAFLVGIPDSTAVGGNKRGALATDLQGDRATAAQVASGDYASIGGGRRNTASASLSTVPGGEENTADATLSTAFGGFAHTRGVRGAMAHAAVRIGSTNGTRQSRMIEIGVETSNDVLRRLTADNGLTSGAGHECNLPDNSVYTVKGLITARSAADMKGWEFTAVIKRDSGAATTAIVGASPTILPTVVAESAGASTWSAVVGADTSAGVLYVDVVGAASPTVVRWGCRLTSVEVVL